MSNTAIIGGGIIGLSIAYYLSEHQDPTTIHIIEATEFHKSASAFAGGFIVHDWFASDVLSLGSLSFDEHARLASVHDGARKWAHSPITTLSQSMASLKEDDGVSGFDWLFKGDSRAKAAMGLGSQDVVAPEWLNRFEGDTLQSIGRVGTTAQVDPKALCEFLLTQCKSRGVNIHSCTQATRITVDTDGTLNGLELSSSIPSVPSVISCTNIVLSSGCWTTRVFQTLFPSAPSAPETIAMPGYSIIFQHNTGTTPYAVFNSTHQEFAPEFFTRIPVEGSASTGGEIWLGGLNPDVLLPDLPTGIPDSPEGIQKLQTVARKLVAGNGEFVRANLCFRPSTRSGSPLMGRISEDKLGGCQDPKGGFLGGVYIATGHGPWGISMSLGTGVVMAELIQGRSLSADISQIPSF